MCVTCASHLRQNRVSRDRRGVLARALARQPSAMTDAKPRLTRVARAAGDSPMRSPLFHWLVRNHDRLAPGLSGARTNWIPVVAAAEKAGVTDQRGQPVTVRTLRDTWRKASKHVEEARSSALARKEPSHGARRSFPRDLPASARPREASASHKSHAPPSSKREGAPLTETPVGGGFRLTLDADGTLGGRPVTHGPLLPEPDYTGMTRSERIIARNGWRIKRRIIG